MRARETTISQRSGAATIKRIQTDALAGQAPAPRSAAISNLLARVHAKAQRRRFTGAALTDFGALA